MRAFTLVEILAVLGILAVLLGLIVPSFKRLGEARALTGAGYVISDLAVAARQNSLSKNAMTALIVVTDPGSSNQYRALTLLQLLPHSNGAPASTSDWQQISRWEILPTGIIVDANSFTADTSAANTLTPPLPASVVYGAQTIQAFGYVVFLPGGNLAESQNVQIRVAEGFYAGAARPTYTHPAVGASPAPADYCDVMLLAASGQAKLVRP